MMHARRALLHTAVCMKPLGSFHHVQILLHRALTLTRTCMLQEGGIEMAFEKSMLPLFGKGVIVNATFQQLGNGASTRWMLSQPGYVWPSWYCQAGCMDKHCSKSSS